MSAWIAALSVTFWNRKKSSMLCGFLSRIDRERQVKTKGGIITIGNHLDGIFMRFPTLDVWRMAAAIYRRNDQRWNGHHKSELTSTIRSINLLWRWHQRNDEKSWLSWEIARSFHAHMQHVWMERRSCPSRWVPHTLEPLAQSRIEAWSNAQVEGVDCNRVCIETASWNYWWDIRIG